MKRHHITRVMVALCALSIITAYCIPATLPYIVAMVCMLAVIFAAAQKKGSQV